MNYKADRLLKAMHTLPAGSIVVEIGCVRAPHEVPTDGWSTVHLATAAKKLRWEMHSVDHDPVAVEHAKKATADLPVYVHLADGKQWLKGFKGPIKGLYLDGSASPEEAVEQYRAARLAPNAIIVIDDIQTFDGNARGKGTALLDVLDEDGYRVDVHETEPGYLMAVAE